MKKISFARHVFENFIIITIILVIVQTFLDELSRYAHWTIDSRNTLMITGFLFDFVFSVEFTLRTFWAKHEKGIIHYWRYERGWIDFLSSIPLLLLDSGPSVYLLLFGHIHQSPSALEVINVFKVIKAIRVTRILRLIRIIKIFGKIHNAESKMAQHHTSEISTIAVFTIICVLLGFSVFNIRSGFNLTELRNDQYKISVESAERIAHNIDKPIREIVHDFYEKDPNILFIYEGETLTHYNIEPETFFNYYDSDDYSVIKTDGISLYVSHIDITKQIALDHIQSLCIIIFIVLAFMILYTRHFVQNISDVIHVMDKGFRKTDYNLQVKIKDEYREHEVFDLAVFYNDRYLPAKIRRIEKMRENKKSGLSMNDLLNFTAGKDPK